jgi:hypothetical protein
LMPPDTPRRSSPVPCHRFLPLKAPKRDRPPAPVSSSVDLASCANRCQRRLVAGTPGSRSFRVGTNWLQQRGLGVDFSAHLAGRSRFTRFLVRADTSAISWSSTRTPRRHRPRIPVATPSTTHGDPDDSVGRSAGAGLYVVRACGQLTSAKRPTALRRLEASKSPLERRWVVSLAAHNGSMNRPRTLSRRACTTAKLSPSRRLSFGPHIDLPFHSWSRARRRSARRPCRYWGYLDNSSAFPQYRARGKKG